MGVRKEPGPSWRTSTPAKMLENRYSYAGAGGTYEVSRDGRRFLMIKERDTAAEGPANHIVLVQHWDQELKRLAPAN